MNQKHFQDKYGKKEPPVQTPPGKIEIPLPKVLQVAPENRQLYSDMLKKLDFFSSAYATAAIPLTYEVNNSLIFSTGLLPLTSYKYSHTVFGRRDTPTEIHFNEVLGENLEPMYALVSMIDLNGIRFRGFANGDTISRVKRDVVGSGYSIQDFETFNRTYMRFGGIHLLLNETLAMYRPGLLGFMEAAVFESDPDTLGRFRQFVSILGHKSAMSLGGIVGPLTGAGRLAAVRLVHKTSPQIVDLSIPESYDEMLRLIPKAKAH